MSALDRSSRIAAQHQGRLQAQAQGEQAKRDAASFNTAQSLLMRDPRAWLLLDLYAKSSEQGRAAMIAAAGVAQEASPREPA